MAAALTETRSEFEQVDRVDGPGDYRLVSNPDSSSLLTTVNPFELGLFPHLVDTESLLSGFSITTHPVTHEVQLEPGDNHLLPGVINLVRAEDGQTAIYFNVDSSNPRGGNEVEFHMLDLEDLIVDGDERVKTGLGYQLLLDAQARKQICRNGGTLDLVVRYYRNPSPWCGRINIGGNPRETIRSTANLLGVVLHGTSVFKMVVAK